MHLDWQTYGPLQGLGPVEQGRLLGVEIFLPRGLGNLTPAGLGFGATPATGASDMIFNRVFESRTASWVGNYNDASLAISQRSLGQHSPPIAGDDVSQVISRAVFGPHPQSILEALVNLLPQPGTLLATNYVLGEQTTTSTTYVDLATPDSVSFTLQGLHDVLILYLAFWGQDTINAIDYNEVFLDGSGQANSEHFNGIPVSRDIATICNYRLSAVTAGAHTVSVRHKVSAGTGFWKNRMLVALIAS